MAERTRTHTRIGPNARRITWSGLTNATSDTGDPYESHEDAIRLVQVTGTFRAGGTVLIEGSLLSDAATFGQLHDTAGSDLSFGDSRVEQIQEGPCIIRPRVSAGDGTTSLVVTIIESMRSRS